jgi:hypothetical protein
MLALLKLIPLKDWAYAGIIAALLIGFGVFVSHERSIGEQKIEVADAALAAKQIELNTEKETHAQDVINTATEVYKNTLAAAPAPDAPHVFVCDRATAPSGSAVRPGASAGSSVDAGTHVPEESSVDIGPGLDTIGRDADAQVIALQSYIRACQAAGACKKDNN